MDKKFWKVLSVIAVVTMVALYFYIAIGLTKTWIDRSPPSYVVPAKIVKAMNGHGTRIAMLDYRDRIYFKRGKDKIFLKARAEGLLPALQ